MLSRAVSIFLIALVSALIWVYLEAESLTQGQQDARVTLVSPGAGWRIEALGDDRRGGTTIPVTIRAEGSQAALSAMPRQFEVSLGSPGFPQQEGEQALDLRVALRSSQALRRSGVNILEVSPEVVRVRVTGLVSLADVEVRPDVGSIEPVAPPTVEPSRVTVTGTRDAIERLQSLPAGPHVVARIAPSTSLPEGQPLRLRTPLILPGSLGALDMDIQPREVEVAFTIRTRTDRLTVASCPVQAMLPPTEAGRYRIQVADDSLFVRDVSVLGPRDVIERLRSQESRLIAVLWLTSDDLEAGKESGTASFAMVRGGQLEPLPAGLVIDAPPPIVRFAISRVEPAAAATP